MCSYCNKSDAEILEDIMKNTVPSMGYSVCGWKRVCQVKSRNKSRVTTSMWSNVCSDRGTSEFANPHY